ncbi:Mov34/MPN/PAD-1 family protein [Brevibacillus sp. NRS-1366]|uniref:Mov34/MPN/PAD-1 family protein n=1 Tax=Brevibacillus sp. NRS-1366 TaxID=3233899 RepID=UPI003D1C36C8
MLPDWLGEPFASKDNKLYLTRKVAKRLLSEAQEAFPYEYSALLTGRGSTISGYLSMPHNHDKHAFAWEGPTFLRALQKIRQTNIQWLGVLHTHPHTPPLPSTSDHSGWHYPMLSYWILGLAAHQPEWQLYQWTNGAFEQRSYTIIDDSCSAGFASASSLSPKNS